MNRFKHLRKRGLALLMALVLCMTMLPTAALAADEEPVKEETEAVVDAAAGEAEEDAGEAEDSEDAAPAGGEEEDSVDAKPAGDKEDGSEDTNPAGGEAEEEDSEDANPAGDESEEDSEDAGPAESETEEEDSEDAKPAGDKEDGSEDAEPTEEEPEEIPAEVQAFLDAVAKIPDVIDAYNAEEVAVLVYGEVSDAYEVLLGTEYEEREDVQTAVAVMAAAIAAVDAAMEMPSALPLAEARATASPTLGDVEMYVGETGTHYSYPRLGFYCNYDNTLIAVATMYQYGECYGGADDETIVEVTSNGYAGNNDQYIQTTVKGLKPGVTTFEIETDVHMVKSGSAVCPTCRTRWGTSANRWVDYKDSWTITTNADYQLTYDANTTAEVETMPSPNPATKTVSATTADFTLSSAVPTRKDGYTFQGWNTKADGTGTSYKAGDTVTLTWSEGYGSTANPVTQTLYAIWEKDTTTNNTTYTVTYTDGVSGKVIFPDQSYEELKVGTKTPTFVGTPSRDGHTFKGWKLTTSSDATHTGVQPTVQAVDANDENEIIYEAIWEEDEGPGLETTYTVIYTDGVEDEVVFEDQKTPGLSEGDNTPAFTGTPSRDGYTFKGWKLTTGTNPREGVQSTVQAADANTQNEIIYEAIWEENEGPGPETTYTVTYTDGVEDEVVFEDQKTPGLSEGDNTPVFTGTPSRDGYTFKGWKLTTGTNPGEGVQPTVQAADANTQNEIIYEAIWEEDEDPDPETTYTVIYTDGVAGVEVFRDQSTGELKVNDRTPDFVGTPARAGYTFGGWRLTTGVSANQVGVKSTVQAADANGSSQIIYEAVWNRVTTPPTPETPDSVIPTPPPAPTPTPVPTPTAPVDNTTTINDEEVPLAAPGLNSVDHYAYIIGYTDGLVHPEANITRAEVATIFFRLMTDEFRMEHWATTNSFSDVTAANWFNNGVSTSANAGIVKGYEDGSFRPNRNITRAEFAAIAARFLSEDAPGKASFSDTSGHWAEKEINRAVAAGWIKGYTDGTFRPDQPITRAEAVTLINRMLDRTPDKDHLLPDMIRWADNTEDKWYYADMQEATNSHDYEREEMILIEDWTELLEIRDWEQLEKEWSTAASALGEEVADNLDLSKIGENA